MNWQDEGFLLSKIKFRENACVINVFTNKRGKVSGIVYGGTSRKTTALLSLSAILNLLLPDSQPYKNLYLSLEGLLKNFEKEDWIIYYINWEIFLLKELGFDPFLKQFSSESNQITKFKTIEIDNTKYLVPIFLLSRKINQKLENKEISMALSFEYYFN